MGRILVCVSGVGLAVETQRRNKVSYDESKSFKVGLQVVFISKGKKQGLYGKISKFLGPVFHGMARQKGGQIEEGHMMFDYVHMLIKIPPKYSVALITGYK